MIRTIFRGCPFVRDSATMARCLDCMRTCPIKHVTVTEDGDMYKLVCIRHEHAKHDAAYLNMQVGNNENGQWVSRRCQSTECGQIG